MFCDRIDTDEEDFDEEVFGLSDDEVEEDRPKSPKPLTEKGPSNNVLRFRRELGLDKPREGSDGDGNQTVRRFETLASKLKNAPPPEVVVFSSKKPCTSDEKKKKRQEILVEKKDDRMNLRKFKHEVYRFGVGGFDQSKREAAMVDLLCSLGAKPDPKPCINYKEFKEKRKAEREAAKKAKAEGTHHSATLLPTREIRTRKPSRFKRRDKSMVRGFDAVPGRFRDGVQFIKPKDVKRMLKSK